ncbi:MAG: ATP-binding protein [Bacteroidales bacterium]
MRQFFRKPRIAFHKSLFFFGTGIFMLFIISAFLYQYNREKSFREQLLNDVLQSYNYTLLQNIENDSTALTHLNKLISSVSDKDIRVTVMDIAGNVISDNKHSGEEKLNNHLDRPEVKGALKKGESYALRNSDTMDEPFFYAAKMSDHYIIRSALPFNVSTKSYLSVEKRVIVFFVVMGLCTLAMMLFFSFRLGNAISSLREFSYKAESDELTDLNFNLPNNDLGDITEHIIRLYTKLSQAKKELSLEKEKLSKHLQISKEGLAVFSAEKQAIFTNTLFIQYINVISDKELSSPEGVFEISELSRIKYFLNLHTQQTNTSNKAEYLSENMLVNKNGKTFHVECIIFQDGTFEISITNITQQEEETRLKRQLTQNVAHELKTPVSSIKGFLETIIDNPNIDPQTQRQFIERSYTQANRLTGLLKDISILNRIDEAHGQFEKETIDLGALVNELLMDSATLLEEKRMHATVSIPEHTVIEGNALLAYSIFRNLLDNSINYAGEGKNISIRCYRQDIDSVYFSFSDNGCGVEEIHLNRLFERFYRVDKGRSRKLGGTGLGLAIVKNAVHFHKGEISAKIRPEGGLEFLFSLKKSNNK